MIYHTYLSRLNNLHKKLINIYIYIKYIYILHLYIHYIYIYTTFIYTLHLYIYYTIFGVEKCRNELESPKKIPTRFHSLQGRDTSFWYTSKIGSGQNLLSWPDSTNSLVVCIWKRHWTTIENIIRNESLISFEKFLCDWC